jgi:selenocysteine lyase/cysteine desulfurase
LSPFDRFQSSYPAYRSTIAIDDLRAREFSRLDTHGHVYLDYTGASLYGECQLRRHMEWMSGGIFGNPHSASPTSLDTTDRVEATRRDVMDFFDADPAEYFLAFTNNASGALKLVGESFPFAPGSQFLLSFDNHNSVNGIREFARSKGAEVNYAPLTMPELRLDGMRLDTLLRQPGNGPRLFAYPAQSNFSGVKHPLEWIAYAQRLGWRVLLDAAAYAPTNRLSLRETKPDFVTLSFYKMFGYPSGVGALFLRKDAFGMLSRPWFSGGTVNLASVQANAHALAQHEGAFEDGTLNYLAIPAVSHGLDLLRLLPAGALATRIECLTDYLLNRLLHLRHSTGPCLARIYGPTNKERRGGTITFNLYDRAGLLIDYRRVEELAGARKISLRTGCFCNPGAVEAAESLTVADMQSGFSHPLGASLPNFVRLLRESGTKNAGAVRVSLGLASNFSDIEQLLQFLESFRDQSRDQLGQVEIEDDTCRVVRDSA